SNSRTIRTSCHTGRSNRAALFDSGVISMAPKKPNIAAERLKRWRQPGSAGFFAFLEDVRPMIPSEKGAFQPFEWPNEHAKAEVAAALDGDFATVIFLWPRRHGKTLTSAL